MFAEQNRNVFGFNKQIRLRITIPMTITFSLRFLYILGVSGLLCHTVAPRACGQITIMMITEGDKTMLHAKQLMNGWAAKQNVCSTQIFATAFLEPSQDMNFQARHSILNTTLTTDKRINASRFFASQQVFFFRFSYTPMSAIFHNCPLPNWKQFLSPPF